MLWLMIKSTVGMSRPLQNNILHDKLFIKQLLKMKVLANEPRHEKI